MPQLPQDFELKMRNLLGDEWDAFLECYLNDRYQALRFNPLKVKAEDETKLLRRLGILQESEGRDNPETLPVSEQVQNPETLQKSEGMRNSEDLQASGSAISDGESGSRVPWALHGYYYGADNRPGKHPWHECGLYYIQEPSAMSAAALLAPKPGMRVLDLCAAPGGKTTQLSSYLGTEGILVANEINNARSKILAQNVERLGIPNCIVTNEDSFALAARFPAYFHAILVDAPCSGEGMFRKNPEAVEEWSLANVELCAKRQAEILDNAAEMLLPGGKMVYSTCTFAPEENERSIAAFLGRHPEFSVAETQAPWFEPARPEWIPTEEVPEEDERRSEIGKTFRLWPHKLHGEGHYAAVLTKAGKLFWEDAAEKPLRSVSACPLPAESLLISEKSSGKKNGKTGKNGSGKNEFGKNGSGKNGFGKNASGKNAFGKNASGKNVSGKDLRRETLLEFLRESLTPEMAAYLLRGNMTEFGDNLYRLPEGAPPLDGLHVVRAGLQIGSFKKDRFEPSHALALFLHQEEALLPICLSGEDPRCRAFFRGETFTAESSDCPAVKTVTAAGQTAVAAGQTAALAGVNAAAADMADRRKGSLPDKGWCLVCVDGYSAGWGKLANGIVKNHYPKGLRKDL